MSEVPLVSCVSALIGIRLHLYQFIIATVCTRISFESAGGGLRAQSVLFAMTSHCAPFLGHFTEYGDFKRRARSIESTPVRTPKAQSSGMKRRVEDDWVVGDGTVGGGVREMTLLVKVCPRGQRESLWLSAFDQAWQAV